MYGTLGIGRTDTTVTAELWMATDEGDWLVDDLEVDVIGGEPVEVQLFANGVFAGCTPDMDCERGLVIALRQTDDAKLKVKARARALAGSPLMGPAPDTAELAVELLEL